MNFMDLDNLTSQTDPAVCLAMANMQETINEINGISRGIKTIKDPRRGGNKKILVIDIDKADNRALSDIWAFLRRFPGLFGEISIRGNNPLARVCLDGIYIDSPDACRDEDDKFAHGDINIASGNIVVSMDKITARNVNIDMSDSTLEMDGSAVIRASGLKAEAVRFKGSPGRNAFLCVDISNSRINTIRFENGIMPYVFNLNGAMVNNITGARIFESGAVPKKTRELLAAVLDGKGQDDDNLQKGQ